MKLPRDMDAPALIKALQRIGYAPVRQTGSHVRLRCGGADPHSITVPNHSPLKLGTLSAILWDIAHRRGISRQQLLDELFG
jgi:predicted RNA binding protein YcfA (HicA-like mRNA interferase family)